MALGLAPNPDVVLETEIPGLDLLQRGKVRDLYDLDYHILMIATDRISAFDVVMPNGIPDKGRVLNQLSAFWFQRLSNVCPNHVIATDVEQIAARLEIEGIEAPVELLQGRAMLCNRVEPLPVEAIVRGYLEGSGWKDYQATGSISGHQLPEGLQQGSRLPEPIFTPSTKAVEGHDENITVEQMRDIVPPGFYDDLIGYSLELYQTAAAYALEKGVIIADTKFEWAIFQGELVLIDECLTPDSSRFWDAERWSPGKSQPSMDKQFVRDYLELTGWDKQPPAPELPEHIVSQTAARYREIHWILTGLGLE